MPNLARISLRDDDGAFRAVVETPALTSVKITYDEDQQIFVYGRPLAVGLVYPHDWGFFPSTVAADGDPLDVLIRHDGKTFPGVVISCRPLGVVRITEKADEGKGRQRNDRIIAVPARDERLSDTHDLNQRERGEIEQFFLSAVLFEKKDVRIEGWSGAKEAEKIITAANKAFEAKHR